MTPITPRNLSTHELIGLDVKVVKDNNPSNVSIQGKVVDESRNTLTIQSSKGAKRVIKKNAIFMFTLPDYTAVEVQGSNLVSRPEDRVKRRTKRAW